MRSGEVKRQETFLAGRLAVRHAQAYLNEPSERYS